MTIDIFSYCVRVNISLRYRTIYNCIIVNYYIKVIIIVLYFILEIVKGVKLNNIYIKLFITLITL